MSVLEGETRFLDKNLSDVEDEPVLSVSCKRKLVEEEEIDGCVDCMETFL